MIFSSRKRKEFRFLHGMMASEAIEANDRFSRELMASGTFDSQSIVSEADVERLTTAFFHALDAASKAWIKVLREYAPQPEYVSPASLKREWLQSQIRRDLKKRADAMLEQLRKLARLESELQLIQSEQRTHLVARLASLAEWDAPMDSIANEIEKARMGVLARAATLEIRDVVLFVERLATNPIPQSLWNSDATKINPPDSLIDSADEALQLGGHLSAWGARKQILKIEKIMARSDENQRNLFAKRAKGREYAVWCAGSGPDHKYYVLVVVE